MLPVSLHPCLTNLINVLAPILTFLLPASRSQPQRTLDCWKEAEDFKAAVAKAEKEFITSFN